MQAKREQYHQFCRFEADIKVMRHRERRGGPADDLFGPHIKSRQKPDRLQHQNNCRNAESDNGEPADVAATQHRHEQDQREQDLKFIENKEYEPADAETDRQRYIRSLKFQRSFDKRDADQHSAPNEYDGNLGNSVVHSI